MYKSKKRALIQVRSCWTFVCWKMFSSVSTAQRFRIKDLSASCFIATFSSSYFLECTIWNFFFLLSRFSQTIRACLMTMISSHSSTMENQIFPIDKHYHLQHFQHFLFTINIFFYFPIIGISSFFFSRQMCDKYFTQYLLLFFVLLFMFCNHS